MAKWQLLPSVQYSAESAKLVCRIGKNYAEFPIFSSFFFTVVRD